MTHSLRFIVFFFVASIFNIFDGGPETRFKTSVTGLKFPVLSLYGVFWLGRDKAQLLTRTFHYYISVI